jgi:hypothetical protein
MNKRKWVVELFLIFFISTFILTNLGAEIVLKVVTVNPSQTKTQEAVLKAYLPKEVVPEQVLNLEDLKINYDVEKNLYYVHKKFELEPGESVTRRIRLEDVWIIAQDELDYILEQVRGVAESLKDTPYANQANVAEKRAKTVISKIIEKQENAKDAPPNIHIAVYRKNLERLEEIKEDILPKLEKEYAKLGREGEGISARRLFVKASWFIILGVIAFLGIISFVLFLVWQKQAKGKEEEKKKRRDNA